MELVDTFGRTINYLRLSVTDRCNFRCSYCMPAEGVKSCRHDEILSYEELLQVVQAALAVGVRKIRVTGGEPLVRKGVVAFLSKLAALPNLRHLALTTNGMLLDEFAAPLKAAGVQRLNVSLDSLNPSRFAAITRGGDLARVLGGIEAAERCGFPLKLNMVVMRGVNDDELLDFAALTMDRPVTVRFIEYMPTVGGAGWSDLLLPAREILSRLAEHYRLQPVEKGELSGPSRDFAIVGGAGTIGIISPVSCHFCADCNRLRVTSTGILRNCLFAEEGIPLRPLLDQGDFRGLVAAMRDVAGRKQPAHRLSMTESHHAPFAMSGIGG
jgi:cyclic pyranopterin phosphate synthase